MSKVMLIILDGLGYQTATDELGYIESLVRYERAAKWKVQTEQPSNSRPLYETLHTGMAPIDHGILTNGNQSPSQFDNLFSLCRKAGLSTAAAAYGWMSELYNGKHFDIVKHREIDDTDQPIQSGRFYAKDDFPDAELFAQAELLMTRHSPDYMLLHPMGCDYAGHCHGGESDEYAVQASRQDSLLATYLPGWLAQGYEVFITADHGMDAKGDHGGTLDSVQYVALYHVARAPLQDSRELINQCAIAPTILQRLNLAIPATMKVAPLGQTT